MNYEPDTVSLSGRIIRTTFPGRPNYESIKKGDEPEIYWILHLKTPLCVNKKYNDPLYRREEKVRRVQLVFMGAEYKINRDLVGKEVIVSGTLFPMMTGHHHTRVLITVNKIEQK